MSISWRATADDAQCLECHGDVSAVSHGGGMIGGVAKESFALGCTDCHEGLDPDMIPHRDPMELVNCLGCHDDLGASHPFHPRIGTLTAVDGASDVSCVGCHGGHHVPAVEADEFRFASVQLEKSCGDCHIVERDAFLASAHKGRPGGPEPDCLSCHRVDIVDSGQSPLEIKLAQSKLCLACHVDEPAAAGLTRLGGRFVASWGRSVHGLALEGGEAAAANCVDCHGSHEMKRAMVADSKVNKLHITETCQGCHEKAAHEFSTGAHAHALRRGIIESPVCTDCHGEHAILHKDDPASPVAPRNVSQELCGDCHGSVKLSRKYGISSDRFQTFADSFHGLATRGGSVEAVNCSSCHGAHGVLPSSDPQSPVNKANLAATCGQCHPGANELFARGSVHVSLDPVGPGGSAGEAEPVVQIIATLYVWAIVLIVGGMFLHNALDFFKKVRRKVRGHVFGVHDAHVPHRLYLRMTVNERLQHGLLVVSFVVLVITGFMLRFPEAWWVAAMRDLNSHLFETRGLVHRIAAVVMVASGVWHGVYVVATQRGRRLIRDLWPRLGDLSDMWGVLRYNLGISKIKPPFGRFSYIEKAEYWALLLGSILMSVTGVLLWADEKTMGLLGKLGFDIARVVHYYEAILATLAIIVWHFYFVIFNPDIYPMNLSWLTGRLSEEEMAEEHPLELERMKAAGEGEVVPRNGNSDGSEDDAKP